VAFGDAEELGDIFPGPLFEHAQRDDRSLDVAELRNAGAQADMFLGPHDELVLKNHIDIGSLLTLELFVGASTKVPAPVIARCVAHDGRKDRRRVGFDLDLALLHQIDEGAEPLLDAVHRILRSEPFASCKRRQRAAVTLGNAGEPIEHIVFGMPGHGGLRKRSRSRPRLHPKAVMDDPVDTFVQRGGASMASEKVHELNELNFESTVVQGSETVLVDFTADWCPPCQRLSPVVARIAEQTAGRVLVGSVDVDACPDLASRFRIRGLPTLIVFQHGKEIARRTGLTDEDGIRALLPATRAPSAHFAR
jgi:thioredoxin 1